MMDEQLDNQADYKSFVRSLAMKKDLWGSSARLVMRLGADCPADARREVSRLKKAGKISKEEASTYLDAISDVDDYRQRKSGCVVTCSPSGGWADIGNGGHIRKTINRS